MLTSVLVNQKMNKNSGVTTEISKGIDARNTVRVPSDVALTISATSLLSPERRLAEYRPKTAKMTCHAARRPRKRRKFWTLTRTDKNSRKEMLLVWYETADAASKKANAMRNRSATL
jgi:hypothetical protein